MSGEIFQAACTVAQLVSGQRQQQGISIRYKYLASEDYFALALEFN